MTEDCRFTVAVLPPISTVEDTVVIPFFSELVLITAAPLSDVKEAESVLLTFLQTADQRQ